MSDVSVDKIVEVIRNNLFLEVKVVPGTRFVEVHLMSRALDNERNPVTVDYVYLDLDSSG